MLDKSIKFLIENKIIVVFLLSTAILAGIIYSPFDWNIKNLPRDPVAVDAIPDIGENQQIVFTPWAGQSPQDVQDQVTQPLSTYLMGIDGIKTIRSSSMFGTSFIYLIFKEGADFYSSRSRILEKLSSLPEGLLPRGVKPTLGPDATGLGQVFWYTLEGRDAQGKTTGGWDLQQLRSIQDYYVRYKLASVPGVSEVASIGGHVKEYQVYADPDKLAQYGLGLSRLSKAISESNAAIGAQTLELNRVEYVVRGLGRIKSPADLENTVVTVSGNTPIRIRDLARVDLGPAPRRGLLDKAGAEAVGGVVIARYGANPMAVIQAVKKRIQTLSKGLPSKLLPDGRRSKLSIVPFYDRSKLIHETLGTLDEALTLEVLITVLVVVFMLMNLRASTLVAGSLPLAVLMVFAAMKSMHITADVVALSGIVIAIGTMVDMGIISVEAIVQRLARRRSESINQVVFQAVRSVSGAIVTSVSTTVVSFIPVFALQASEGKLFHPLAYTKSLSLVMALVVTLWFIPPLAAWLFGFNRRDFFAKPRVQLISVLAGVLGLLFGYSVAAILIVSGVLNLLYHYGTLSKKQCDRLQVTAILLAIVLFLSAYWMPLGVMRGFVYNAIFVSVIVFGLLAAFYLFQRFYVPILRWALRHKALVLLIPLALIAFALYVWRGTGSEFMPSLNEGSFLYMPTTTPHAGVAQNKENLKRLDASMARIPEVESVLGKAGRVQSALDPAPLSMYEILVNYKSEYASDPSGRRLRFKTNAEGLFLRRGGKPPVSSGTAVSPADLIPDPAGRPYRQWRRFIHSPDDIWAEIQGVARLPGLTSAPKLQPIETRLLMLQTGMRAPMGIKVEGDELMTMQRFSLKLEHLLKQIPGVEPKSVFADRTLGKPYLTLEINREKAARYGLRIAPIQQAFRTAVGGKVLTQTLEGPQRYGVRLRYPRAFRNTPEAIAAVRIPTPTGQSVLLGQLGQLTYETGPQSIKGENGFLVAYVLFDKRAGENEWAVVQHAQRFLQQKIDSGELRVPPGITYSFAGNYQNQLRASRRLSLVVPLTLLLIFLIVYLQFRELSTALFVFSGVFVAFSGAFLLIWLYRQPWFLNFHFLGVDLRALFQVHPIELSVAVWVGFIALFGIATEDGVVMATYLKQVFARDKPKGLESIHQAVIRAGSRRIRPCLMTTATTLLALLPVLTASGRGSDIMIPMSIPTFGGMAVVLITLFVVPLLYAWRAEINWKKNLQSKRDV